MATKIHVPCAPRASRGNRFCALAEIILRVLRGEGFSENLLLLSDTLRFFGRLLLGLDAFQCSLHGGFLRIHVRCFVTVQFGLVFL